MIIATIIALWLIALSAIVVFIQAKGQFDASEFVRVIGVAIAALAVAGALSVAA